jgi:hypothetical protein
MEVCDKAKEIIDTMASERSEELVGFLENCESPIEQILVAAMCDSWGAIINTHFNRLQSDLPSEFPLWDGIFKVLAYPQKEIKTYENTYRADFFLCLTRFWYGVKEDQPEWGKVVIEVDGHDFHEKTKRQASYDKKRDRSMVLEGYQVLRFTGSDIFNKPYECVEEIGSHLNKVAQEVFDIYAKDNRITELVVGKVALKEFGFNT